MEEARRSCSRCVTQEESPWFKHLRAPHQTVGAGGAYLQGEGASRRSLLVRRGLEVLALAQGKGGALSEKGAEGFFGYSLTCRETAVTNSSTRHKQLSEYL